MTDTPDVSPRARAALPRGFGDRDASDLAAAEAMIARIGEVYALYGFEAVETPSASFCPIRIGRTKACSRSRTTTSNGCRCATI
jgi:hypothetical protein